jgi:hypothetical protein
MHPDWRRRYFPATDITSDRLSSAWVALDCTRELLIAHTVRINQSNNGMPSHNLGYSLDLVRASLRLLNDVHEEIENLAERMMRDGRSPHVPVRNATVAGRSVLEMQEYLQMVVASVTGEVEEIRRTFE